MSRPTSSPIIPGANALEVANLVIFSTQALSDLLRSKGADSVEAKTKDKAIFVALSNIERVILNSDSTAIISVAKRRRRADQR